MTYELQPAVLMPGAVRFWESPIRPMSTLPASFWDWKGYCRPVSTAKKMQRPKARLNANAHVVPWLCINNVILGNFFPKNNINFVIIDDDK